MQQRQRKVEQETPPAAALPRASTAQDLLEAEEAPEQGSMTPRKKSKKGAGEKKRWRSVVNFLLVAFLMAAPPAVVLLVDGGDVLEAWFAAARAQLRRGSGDASFPDKLLGGLLADGIDEKTCRSRHESSAYRRNPPRRPSPYLVAKLRRHEELQRRCGPGSDAYGRAVQQLSTGRSAAVAAECKYVVSVCNRGLGNRILAAASAFLYAVLTDRVLLIDRTGGLGELFCEPFPGATWLLPRDFPVTGLDNFTVDAAETYGNMLKNKVLTTETQVRLPALACLYLEHDYGDGDKRFFCDDDQRVLSNVQWLVARMDTYVVPGLFQVPSFAEELAALFPERDAVFHHLGRYLFHPADHVWGLVSRYYRAYLARAEHLVGVQVRVFESSQGESPHVLRQITSCLWKQKLLPEVLLSGKKLPAVTPAPGAMSKTVLITSLRPWFYERIKSMYWEQATASGEDVGVHQPSHEEYQHFGEKSHDTKACAEMYLLSMCDALVTSGWSTFGYVAQGLAGVTPWVMYRPENISMTPDPPCGRDESMEPCFHTPPMYDCKAKQTADTARSVPHLRRCQDVKWGLKLVLDPK